MVITRNDNNYDIVSKIVFEADIGVVVALHRRIDDVREDVSDNRRYIIIIVVV